MSRNSENNLVGQPKKDVCFEKFYAFDSSTISLFFVKISEAKSHDKNFLQHLVLPESSMIVFDKAYNHYFQFAKWAKENINFLCRLKDNAVTV